VPGAFESGFGYSPAHRMYDKPQMVPCRTLRQSDGLRYWKTGLKRRSELDRGGQSENIFFSEEPVDPPLRGALKVVRTTVLRPFRASSGPAGAFRSRHALDSANGR